MHVCKGKDRERERERERVKEREKGKYLVREIRKRKKKITPGRVKNRFH
jgi:hypothetical protein